MDKDAGLKDQIFVDFPWLEELGPLADDIVKGLIDKERSYRGSWQKRGGVGAFMMLARK